MMRKKLTTDHAIGPDATLAPAVGLSVRAHLIQSNDCPHEPTGGILERHSLAEDVRPPGPSGFLARPFSPRHSRCTSPVAGNSRAGEEEEVAPVGERPRPVRRRQELATRVWQIYSRVRY